MVTITSNVKYGFVRANEEHSTVDSYHDTDHRVGSDEDRVLVESVIRGQLGSVHLSVIAIPSRAKPLQIL